jgi:hypothetical protein
VAGAPGEPKLAGAPRSALAAAGDVAVTVEQAGGVDRPTRQPIITSEQAA